MTKKMNLAAPALAARRHAMCTTDERELYDLKRDPGELSNIYNKTKAAIQTRLEALLAVLVVCKGESCTNPWKVRLTVQYRTWNVLRRRRMHRPRRTNHAP